PLSTAKNRQGERFEAVLDTDLEIDGQVVVPRGSTIAGRLTEVDPSGRVKGRARMTLTLSDVVVGGESYPIHTNALSPEAEAPKGAWSGRPRSSRPRSRTGCATAAIPRPLRI